jgi:hypothetical protein
MTTPVYRRSIRDVKEALRGLLPFYTIGLDSRSLGKLVLLTRTVSRWEVL